MGHSHSNANEHHSPGYGLMVLVWLALMGLTGLTVAVAGIDLGALNVLGALGIATVKTTLVVLFFMHVKYEDRVFHYMILVTMVILAIIVSLTYVDTLYR